MMNVAVKRINPLLIMMLLTLTLLGQASFAKDRYVGFGLSKIVLKGIPGNPEFLAPTANFTYIYSENLLFQGRLTYGGRGDTFADLDHSMGFYGILSSSSRQGFQPYLMLGLTSTKFSYNAFFFSDGETTSGMSVGLGANIIMTEKWKVGLELLGLNREEGHVNTALSLNFYYLYD